jgi:molybdopterin-guanine dinucleotide biosynthesis protein A
MGAPKAWLEFEGRPLLEHLVERMLRRFPEAVIVGAPGQELPHTAARVVWDEAPGEGPVAGLVVGLREIGRTFAFVSSCDVPFLTPSLAEHLLNRAGEYEAVMPEWDSRLHPLLAVYRTSAQPAVEAKFAAGLRRATELSQHLRTLVVPEEELRGIGAGPCFFNVNTPDDYARARRLN